MSAHRLKIARHEDALVAPIRRIDMRRIVNAMETGVYSSCGKLIEESQLIRSYGPVSTSGVFKEKILSTDEVIYAGIWNTHFGHFITESLSRAWAVKYYPKMSLAFSVLEGCPESQPRVLSWQREILQLLGIDNNFIFVREPTRFNAVIVPQAGFIIRDFFHQEHSSFLSRIDFDPEPGKRTWISRKNNTSDVNIAEFMADTENKLVAQGWNIVCPEEYTFGEQIQIYRTSERLAGLMGSAFHALVFIRNIQRLQVDLFYRGSSMDAFTNYETIAERLGFTQTIHRECRFQSPRTDPETDSTSNALDYIVDKLTGFHDNADVLPFSQNKVMTSSNGTLSSRRINQILRLLDQEKKNYLEIGVANGHTFFSVNADRKVAVDPHFRFDISKHSSENVNFYEMPSDSFFATMQCDDEVFDFIFIDGLHTFQQTFRDFCASQALSHSRTIWLIDDIWPTDVFSTLRTHKDAILARRSAGIEGEFWHGDTFKTILAIHDFFPNMCISSFSGSNRQTVCYKGNRRPRVPIFSSLEEIERLSFFDLSKVAVHFNFHRDDAIIDDISSFTRTKKDRRQSG